MIFHKLPARQTRSPIGLCSDRQQGVMGDADILHTAIFGAALGCSVMSLISQREVSATQHASQPNADAFVISERRTLQQQLMN